MAKKEKEITKKQKGHYFKDMKAELKKVIWPTPKQLLNNTLAVIAFTLVLAVIVFVLDVCFDAINKYGVVAMQEKIQSSYNASQNVENETTENEENADENNTSEENNEEEDNSEENATEVNVETNTESQE